MTQATASPRAASQAPDLPRPAIGVGAVVFDDERRVLLIRRAQAPALGLWSVPGGRLEAGESLRECCRREVMEETGIAVEPGPIVAVAERIRSGFHYVIVDFAATLKVSPAPEPMPATDASAACWVGLDDLDGYELVEGLADVIRSALASREQDWGLGLRDRAGRGKDYLAGCDKRSSSSMISAD